MKTSIRAEERRGPAPPGPRRRGTPFSVFYVAAAAARPGRGPAAGPEREPERERDSEPERAALSLGNNVHDGGVQGAARHLIGLAYPMWAGLTPGSKRGGTSLRA